MWVVNGTYVIQPGQRDSFVRAVAEHRIIEQIRNEEGNLSYNYYDPIDDGDTLFFVGVWKSERAWREHLENDYVTQDLQQIKDSYMKELKISVLGELTAK